MTATKKKGSMGAASPDPNEAKPMSDYMDEKFREDHKSMFVMKANLQSLSDAADHLVTANTKAVRLFNHICRKQLRQKKENTFRRQGTKYKGRVGKRNDNRSPTGDNGQEDIEDEGSDNDSYTGSMISTSIEKTKAIKR
jgi:hypothetical protein